MMNKGKALNEKISTDTISKEELSKYFKENKFFNISTFLKNIFLKVSTSFYKILFTKVN